ncbi:MAG: aromatic aminobenezylarsenical efflux permease ArsG family transporter [Rikenellaceae bacterium]
MEIIQTWLENSNTPILTAFLLGILTAVSPCPLATNITAIGFISKDIENKHRIFWNGILYTVGRILSYSIIGIILIPILQEGASIFKIQKTISKYGELLISPALILIGLFMLFGNKLKLPSFGFKGDTESGEKLKKRGGIGALLLGVLFALAFCPTSGVFYFGMLIPMSASTTGTAAYLYPSVFAIATGLPVIIVAWILAYSVSGMGKFYNNIRTFQKWFNIIVAILFIVVGIYYGVIYYF